VTHLRQFWPYTAHQVDVHQVRLRPERPETCSLQCRPPTGEVLEVLTAVTRVDLELELPDGKDIAF
jgi:hypothetical protein